MRLTFLVPFVLALSLAGSSPVPKPQGATLLDVYVVPHSHDDVGWIFTIDEYFDIFVKRIYDSVVKALSENPARRFISVEMAFFSKWWYQATPEQQAQVYALVANKQLEFVVGGWTMEDEACTTWTANIDQMTEGHAFISSLFGATATPRFGWQIDPFGHSSNVHAQFAQMGFDATVLDRIPYDLKKSFEATKSLEFVWEPYTSLGSSLPIFTHTMDQYGYSTHPTGMDWGSGDRPVTPSTVKEMADKWVTDMHARASWFQGSVLLVPWGDDFQHFNATWDFHNMDILIDYINNNTATYGVNVQYATLSEYFRALNAQNLTYSVRDSTDFFPYDDNSRSYWSGYYTSRNALKGFTRASESLGRAAEIAHVLSMQPWGSRDGSADAAPLTVMRRANGEATHHDAVSGTAEEWVNVMYVDHLQNGTNNVLPLIGDALSAMLAQATSTNTPVTAFTNTTLPALAVGESIPLVFFNSLGWTLSRFIQVPCENNDIRVVDDQGNAADFDILPAVPLYGSHCTVPNSCGIPTSKPYNLFVRVSVPPVGYRTYTVTRTGQAAPYTVEEVQEGATAVLANGNWVLGFTSAGLLSNMTNLQSGVSVQVNQTFAQYRAEGVVPIEKKEQPGGAYIFQPLDNSTALVDALPKPVQIVRGKFVQEARQMFTAPCDPQEWQKQTCGVSQTFRIYDSAANTDDEGLVETVSTVGPLESNVDFVSRWQTDMASLPGFYSDNNCFHTQLRVRNASRSEYIPGNFYPVTCHATLVDSAVSTQMTWLSDRTRGGASLSTGDMQIMLHRRNLATDGRGPLNLDDKDHLEGLRLWVLLGDTHNITQAQKRLQYLLQVPPVVALGTPAQARPQALRNNAPPYSALRGDLPRNVHLASLLQINATTNILVRLAHIDDAVINAGNPLAQPVSLDLASIFGFAQFEGAVEMTLSAIQPLANVRRMQWNASSQDGSQPQVAQRAQDGSYSITLNPGDVRTFMVKFAAL